jgi:plastocyanin
MSLTTDMIDKKWLSLILTSLLLGIVGLATAAEHVVTINHHTFQPPSLRIKPGDTVRWINQEKRTSHSVLFKETEVLESERLFPDESWSRRFDTPGQYPYTCGPHPDMHGHIEVIAK